MSEHPNLPNTVNWQARVQYALRALTRDATRYQTLTLAQAPADLNTPHVDFLLRPSMIGQLQVTLAALSRGIYNVETHARFRRYRPEDGADLTQARQHLTQAAQHLAAISKRAEGSR